MLHRHRMILLAVAALSAPVVLPPARGAWAADPDRGRALYELRCDGCHTQSVHGRKQRVAADFAQVRSWVGRWNESLGLRWSDAEIDDVAIHLNNSYYRYPCPPTACKVVSLTTQRAMRR